MRRVTDVLLVAALAACRPSPEGLGPEERAGTADGEADGTFGTDASDEGQGLGSAQALDANGDGEPPRGDDSGENGDAAAGDVPSANADATLAGDAQTDVAGDAQPNVPVAAADANAAPEPEAGAMACGNDCGSGSSSSVCPDSAYGDCCTDGCDGGPSCLAESSTEILSCSVGTTGCTATPSPCAAGLVCERYPMAACVDPGWAEWPMPNAPVDVAAGAPTPESYADNGDGTVTDNVTGLVWQQAVPETIYVQADARAYCARLSLGGLTDWRLPTVVELVSIVDPGVAPPTIDKTYFPNTPPQAFWSSTPFAQPPAGNGWDVFFGGGYTAILGSNFDAQVRCVR